jgi:hypothetical protein
MSSQSSANPPAEPKYADHATLEFSPSKKLKSKKSKKPETDYARIVGTQTPSRQIAPLSGSRPTDAQKEALLQRIINSGNARPPSSRLSRIKKFFSRSKASASNESHAGGAYKKTRKNKKRSKHNIRSKKQRK